MASITGYGSKHSHEFTLTVNEDSTSQSGNYSVVSFTFTLYKSSYSWSGWNSITYSININGTTYTGTIPSYSAGSTLTIKTGSLQVPHDNDGTKLLYFSFSVTDNSGQSYTCGNASASGSMYLTNIPRYPAAFQSLRAKTDTSIQMNWSSDKTIDALYYSINGGTTWNYVGNPNAAGGYYTISNLVPNTTYSIVTRMKSRDSQLYGNSTANSIQTYDIARLQNLTEIIHGDNNEIKINNPGNRYPLSLSILINQVEVISRSISSSTYNLVFSVAEADQIYALYGNSQEISSTVILTADGQYTDELTIPIKYKGNQRTIKVDIEGAIKRGKVSYNKQGSWKRATTWTNVQGTWKRGK